MAKRVAYFDNVRVALILLVVLAHGIELVPDPQLAALYQLIYLFHMPAFIALSGYFTRKQSRIKIGNLFLQYLLLQPAYLLFVGWLHGRPVSGIAFSYATPYWILWFSFATMFWKMMAPYLARLPRGAAVALSVAGALAAGYFSDIGYLFSASRILVFLPFFMAGYLLEEKHVAMIRKIPFFAGLAALAVSYFLLLRVVHLPTRLLYGSFAYASMDLPGGGFSGPFWRLLAMGWGALLVIAFLACIPAKKLPVFTGLGTNTLPVYYLHGFVLRWAAIFISGLVAGAGARKLLFFLAILAVALVLASKPVAWLLQPLVNPVRFLGAGYARWKNRYSVPSTPIKKG